MVKCKCSIYVNVLCCIFISNRINKNVYYLVIVYKYIKYIQIIYKYKNAD